MSRNINKILIGAIDQSTSGTKFAVFNTAGDLVEKSLIPHKQITPKQGWLEHDPSEILSNCKEAINQTMEGLRKKGYSKEDIKTIGITNQRETVVAWNRNTGKPYHSAIVWNDQRTQEICKRWTEKHNGNRNVYSEITGLPINTYFSAFKIRWLLENVEALKNEPNKDEIMYGTMDSWLIWNLTDGIHITDVTNASRTFLMNLNTLQYEPKILEEFGIQEESLPKIRSSAEEYGKIQYDALKNVTISAIVGDQQAASIGHGLFTEGSSKNTYGSGCFLLVNQGQQPKFQPQAGLLTTVLFQLGQQAKPVYAFEGSIEVGALTINWARDKLQLFEDFEDLDNQVQSVQDNGGVYFVPTLSGAYSPYWQDNATGTLVGMSFYTQRAHILRALLESIAYRTKDVIDVVEKAEINVDNLNVDGGVTSNEFLMNFQSNILQKPLTKNKIMDSTCLGAVFAAGLGAGIYKDTNEVKKLIEIESVVNCDPAFLPESEELYSKWQSAVPRAFDFK